MDDVISGKIILDIEMAKKFIEECAQQITHPLKHDSQTAVSQYNRKICGKKKQQLQICLGLDCRSISGTKTVNL